MLSDFDPPEFDRQGNLPHPRERADLFGHESSEAMLLDAFRSGRLHHAWILAGPRGIGKATLAYRFARAVLKYGGYSGKQSLETLGLPEQDLVFQQVASLGHPDLLVLRRPWDPEKKRFKAVLTVDEVRRTAAFYGKSAGGGGWRVCILDSADDLNSNAANALLKVLEEPPPKSLFLIICHTPGRLLSTIRSRSRMLTLRPVGDNAVARMLSEHFPDLPHTDRQILVRLAGGSPGCALALAEGNGLDFYRAMLALVGPLPRLDIPAAHALGDRLARDGEGALRLFLEMLAGWLARVTRGAAAGHSDAEIVPGEGETMRRIAGQGGLDRWIELWEKVNSSLTEAEGLNLDRRQIVLNVFGSLQAASQG